MRSGAWSDIYSTTPTFGSDGAFLYVPDPHMYRSLVFRRHVGKLPNLDQVRMSPTETNLQLQVLQQPRRRFGCGLLNARRHPTEDVLISASPVFYSL